jgi:hypothetical protein
MEEVLVEQEEEIDQQQQHEDCFIKCTFRGKKPFMVRHRDGRISAPATHFAKVFGLPKRGKEVSRSINRCTPDTLATLRTIENQPVVTKMTTKLNLISLGRVARIWDKSKMVQAFINDHFHDEDLRIDADEKDGEPNPPEEDEDHNNHNSHPRDDEDADSRIAQNEEPATDIVLDEQPLVKKSYGPPRKRSPAAADSSDDGIIRKGRKRERSSAEEKHLLDVYEAHRKTYIQENAAQWKTEWIAENGPRLRAQVIKIQEQRVEKARADTEKAHAVYQAVLAKIKLY